MIPGFVWQMLVSSLEYVHCQNAYSNETVEISAVHSLFTTFCHIIISHISSIHVDHFEVVSHSFSISCAAMAQLTKPLNQNPSTFWQWQFWVIWIRSSHYGMFRIWVEIKLSRMIPKRAWRAVGTVHKDGLKKVHKEGDECVCNDPVCIQARFRNTTACFCMHIS